MLNPIRHRLARKLSPSPGRAFLLKLACICLSILATSALAQRNQTLQQDTQSTSVTATTLTFSNDIGAISASFEYIITGAPATVSIIAKGCMRSGTCDTLETYTTVANSIRKPNASSVAYDNYQFVVSFTGGTNPAVQINRLTTLARSGGSDINGTPVIGNCASFASASKIQDAGAPCGTSTITNTAGANVVPKSDGTNLVPTPIQPSSADIIDFVFGSRTLRFADDANNVYIQTGAPNMVIGVNGIAQTNFTIASGTAAVQPQDAVWKLGDSTHRWTNVFTQGITGISAFLTSNYTNATTTFSNVTGLSFTVAASQNYKVRCDLDYQTSANTADVKIQWTGPASPTAVTYDLVTEVTGTTLSASVATAFSTALSEAGTPTITTNFPLTATLTLINGANAGTIQLQAAATGVGTITIVPGSCNMTQ